MRIFIIFIFIHTSLNANTLLESTCRAVGGVLKSEITCPSSKVVREGEFCVQEDPINKSTMFYNGCTSSVPGFSDLFFMACYFHDHCYHHEPATTGMSKRDCDKQLERQLYDVCDSIGHTMKRGYTCNQVARATYLAVKFGGDSSWECSNTKANYPTSISREDHLPALR